MDKSNAEANPALSESLKKFLQNRKKNNIDKDKKHDWANRRVVIFAPIIR